MICQVKNEKSWYSLQHFIGKFWGKQGIYRSYLSCGRQSPFLPPIHGKGSVYKVDLLKQWKCTPKCNSEILNNTYLFKCKTRHVHLSQLKLWCFTFCLMMIVMFHLYFLLRKISSENWTLWWWSNIDDQIKCNTSSSLHFQFLHFVYSNSN